MARPTPWGTTAPQPWQGASRRADSPAPPTPWRNPLTRGVAMVITRADRIGGAQVHVLHLALALRARGIPVTVISGPPGPFTEELARAGVPHHTLPQLVRPLRPLADLRALAALRRLLAQLGPALVAAHSAKAGWLSRLASRSLGLPCVYTVHGWPFATGLRPQEATQSAAGGVSAPGPGSSRKLPPAAAAAGRRRPPVGLVPLTERADPAAPVLLGPGGGPGNLGAASPEAAGEGWSAAGLWMVLAAERSLRGAADAVITVCRHDRDVGVRLGLLDPRRTVVIPNGIPDVRPPPDRSPTSAPQARLRVVMVARFEAPKDHATLLRAAAQIPPAIPWRLELVGDGPQQPAARALAQHLGIADRVHFLGARPPAAIQDLLAGADVFVLSTGREGLPLAILEAMRARLPVVASAVGGVPEAVVHGLTGYLVPPGDPQALAGRLRALLSDRGLRERLGAAGRRRFQKDYTLAAMVRRTLAVYRGVVGRAGAGVGG